MLHGYGVVLTTGKMLVGIVQGQINRRMICLLGKVEDNRDSICL